MALHDYDSAVAAFAQGAELEPADKGFKDQLAKAEQAAATRRSTSEQSHPQPATTERAAPQTEVKRSKTTQPLDAEPATSTAASGTAAAAREANDMRGYKILEDGRKTTCVSLWNWSLIRNCQAHIFRMLLSHHRYFNRELTEEEKALIGDIAPKKVETAEDVRAGVGSGGCKVVHSLVLRFQFDVFSNGVSMELCRYVGGEEHDRMGQTQTRRFV